MHPLRIPAEAGMTTCGFADNGKALHIPGVLPLET